MSTDPYSNWRSDPSYYWRNTAGSALVSIIVFFALLYVVAPIAESILNLHGRLFVPERFGGGTTENPGLLTLVFRAILVSGLSAVGGLVAGQNLFPAARSQHVAIVFAVAVLAWATLFIVLSSGAGQAPLVTAALGAIPPLAVAYWAWHEGL